MLFLSTIRDYARTRRANRSRLNAYLRVAELPADIRKDIGWRGLRDDAPPSRH